MGGLELSTHVNFVLVFLEGILSFFSPCVLPLIPVYMGYLAGNAKEVREDGSVVYKQKKVFFYTLCFILGVSAAFFVLGLSFSALGSFLNAYKLLISRIGGAIIILLGLFQLGVFHPLFMQKEHKVTINITGKKMNPFLAVVMGFTFSFAWTPCVGPMLSSVLILASGAKTALVGNLLVLVYAIGFVIPFLLLGLFTAKTLNFLKNKQKLLRYTIKVGGAILLLMGILMMTGWMNSLSSYLGGLSNKQDGSISPQPTTTATPAPTSASSGETKNEIELTKAFDFTLKDQYGNTHTLSDYEGKVVFLNFWATWCGPCQKEMPHIEELYNEYGKNTGDVVILGVANPKSPEYPTNQDGTQEEITGFLQENGYTFPTVFDAPGQVFAQYRINAFPTTFLITKDGYLFGYVPGMMEKEMMQDAIRQTLDYSDGGAQ